MDDAVRVRRFERFSDLTRDGEGLNKREAIGDRRWAMGIVTP